MQQWKKRTGVLACCLLFMGYGLTLHAENADQGATGPEHVVWRSVIDAEAVPRPVYFPHKEHQWLECDVCHHSFDESGKRIAHDFDEKVPSCESCHNSKADDMPWHLGTVKRVGHYYCLPCHLHNGDVLGKCGTCHNPKSN
ncbi:MAG: cytochrome c3 family protein [Desulfobulbus sp.]|jgi:hypothetical protein